MPEKLKVDIREIYALLCPKCKAKLEKAMMAKLQQSAIRAALEAKPEGGKQ